MELLRIGVNTLTEDPAIQRWSNVANFNPIFHADDACLDPQYQVSFTTSGGIMADEMGLGKTITMLSLILSNPRIPDPECTYDKTLNLFQVTTLVICPPHIVDQWANEITSRTS